MNSAKSIRLDLGETRRSVSIATGVTERTIARLENGESLSGRSLQALASHYKVTIDSLLGREEKE